MQYHFVIQGEFTSWNDRSLLTHSFWSESNQTKDINKTNQILSHNIFITESSGAESWTNKQP